MNDEPSQAAIARALGLAKSRITAMKKQGMPVHSIEAAQAWREARQSIARRKPVLPVTVAREVKPDGSELGETHDMARTRREIAEANLSQMRDAEMSGELIRVAAVKTVLASALATTRDALLQIPARLAPLLAADADQASVQNTLHTEIHQALQYLSGASDRLRHENDRPERTQPGRPSKLKKRR